MKNLSELKRAMQVGTMWRVRWSHAPENWASREVAHVQGNAVAFIRGEVVADLSQNLAQPEEVEAYKERCRKSPNSNASWHWWGKAGEYQFNSDGSVRVLIGPSWDDPRSGWMEYIQA